MNDPIARPSAPMDRPAPAPFVHPTFDPAVPDALTSAPLTPVARESGHDNVDDAPRIVSGDLNRELLRQARAQFRERQQNKGYSAPQPERAPERDPLVISNQFIPPSRDVQSTPAQGVTNSIFRFAEQAQNTQFDAVPELDAEDDPPRSERTMRQSVDRSSRLAPQMPSLEPDLADFSWTAQPVVPEPELPAFDSSYFEDLATDVKPSVVDEFPESYVERDLDDRWGAAELEHDDWAQPTQQPPEAQGIWADIPRCCLTCRDFRPAGNGERGWCNNQWAFKHRRMVDANDRPCETSIGHWWIPGDAAWQGEFDISALGQPTPLMDKWFGRSTGIDDDIGEPVERRRRRTGSW